MLSCACSAACTLRVFSLLRYACFYPGLGLSRSPPSTILVIIIMRRGRRMIMIIIVVIMIIYIMIFMIMCIILRIVMLPVIAASDNTSNAKPIRVLSVRASGFLGLRRSVPLVEVLRISMYIYIYIHIYTYMCRERDIVM